MLYLWEFALLRDDGAVAFLRPHPNTTDVEYYEGLLKDDVPEEAGLSTYDQVPTWAIVRGFEEAAQYNQAGLEFPNSALLTYASPQRRAQFGSFLLIRKDTCS